MASSLGIWQGSWGHIAATILLAVLATLAVALRFWSRRRQRISSSGIHADDWLVLAALVVNYGLSATVFVAFIADGLGYNMSTLEKVDSPAAVEVQKLTFIGTVLYGTGATCIRLSVILFYFRIFSAKIVRRGSYAIATVCLLWFVSIETLNLAACKPIAKAWDGTVERSKCGPVAAGVIVLGSISVVINAVIVALPAREISKLNLSGEKRFLVVVFFLIGVIVTIASVARLVSITIFVMHESNATSALPSTTIGYEIYLAIVGACAPTLGPVYNKARNRSVLSSDDAPIPHNNNNRRSAYTTKKKSLRRSHHHVHVHQQAAAIITNNLAHLSRTALRESDDEERPFKQRFEDVQVPHHHVLVPPKERGEFWTDISARPASGGVPLGGIRVQRDVTWNSEE